MTDQQLFSPDKKKESKVTQPKRSLKKSIATAIGVAGIVIGIVALVAAYIHGINNTVGFPLAVAGLVVSIVSMVIAQFSRGYKFYGGVGLTINAVALIIVGVTNVIMNLATQRAAEIASSPLLPL